MAKNKTNDWTNLWEEKMRFNDWLRGKNRGGDEVEFYEDTHDENGNYIGRQAAQPSAPLRPTPIVPDSAQGSQKPYGNIVVYRPATPEEVETLISFLKRGEPAVANLNELDDLDAQRILDFLSGAIFALGGNIHRITGNIFLLSPSGVEIQSYYDKT